MLPDVPPALPRRATHARDGVPRTLVLGAVLLVLGLVLWAASQVIANGQAQAYASGPAPVTVRLSAGHSYWLAVPGGVRSESAAGVRPNGLRCSASQAGQQLSLHLTDEGNGTKMINNIASFVAPVTGAVSVNCVGLARVYVPDAVNAGFDLPGLLLMITCVLLTLASAFLLSGLRRLLMTRTRRPGDSSPRPLEPLRGNGQLRSSPGV